MNNTFTQFLTRLPGQREISLIIADDETQEKEFHDTLAAQEYEHISSLPELLDRTAKPAKLYSSLTADNQKSVYDIAAQYPTGQIQLFDTKTMKHKTAVPEYTDSAVIFTITRDRLQSMQKSGLDILRYAGMAYQE